MMNTISETYLSDESKKIGFAEKIFFPQSVEELENIPLEDYTVQGALTGVDGLAVPSGGTIVNMSRMKKLLEVGEDYLIAEAGMTLEELEQNIRKLFKGKGLRLIPNPTEKTATLGGIVKTNAYGMSRYAFGETSRYITAENTVGDIITSVRVKLASEVEEQWAICLFLDTQDVAVQMAVSLDLFNKRSKSDSAYLSALEYIDENTLDIIRQHKVEMSSIHSVPPIPECGGMLILGLEGESGAVAELAESILEITELLGDTLIDTWAVSDSEGLEMIMSLRHAVPEASYLNTEGELIHFNMNATIGDMAAAVESVQAILNNAKIQYDIFGHIGLGILHINLFPKDTEQYEKANEICRMYQNGTVL